MPYEQWVMRREERYQIYLHQQLDTLDEVQQTRLWQYSYTTDVMNNISKASKVKSYLHKTADSFNIRGCEDTE